MGGFGKLDLSFDLHLSGVISGPDVKRNYCSLSVQEPLRVEEDLEEEVGRSGGWVTLSVLGLSQGGRCQLGEGRFERAPC